MRIFQLTDLHLTREGQATDFGIDIRQRFLTLLNIIRWEKPDYLMITGDVCYEIAEREVYEWAKAQLDDLKIPYSVLSGNHDESVMMAEVFGVQNHLLHGNELFYYLQLGQYDCICLDSARGALSDLQMGWLQQQFRHIEGEVIVFMHHPPLQAGVPFMDTNYPMKQTAPLLNVFNNHSHAVHLYCGHYHVEKNLRLQNLSINITPSLYFQLDRHAAEFRLDNTIGGFREIVLQHGMVSSTVRYLEQY